MKNPTRFGLAAVAALGALALLAPTMAQAAPAAAPGFTQMNLYLMAHPDDEASSLGVIEDTTAYKVFIYATSGNATNYCSGGALDRTGEYEPPALRNDSTGAFTGPNTQGCVDSRRDSMHKFHDDLATIDPGMETRGALTTITGTVYESDFSGTGTANAPYHGQTAIGDARSVQFFVGSKNARVLYNLGDGNLTAEEVRWAVNTVKRNLNLLPAGLTFRDVVGLSYANTSNQTTDPATAYEGCSKYQHPDHVAIHAALASDLAPEQASSAQYASTCKNDPKVALIDSPSDARWAAVSSSPYPNLGKFQHRYGWLAAGHWPMDSGFQQQDSTFHQYGTFWRKFA